MKTKIIAMSALFAMLASFGSVHAEATNKSSNSTKAQNHECRPPQDMNGQNGNGQKPPQPPKDANGTPPNGKNGAPPKPPKDANGKPMPPKDGDMKDKKDGCPPPPPKDGQAPKTTQK